DDDQVRVEVHDANCRGPRPIGRGSAWAFALAEFQLQALPLADPAGEVPANFPRQLDALVLEQGADVRRREAELVSQQLHHRATRQTAADDQDTRTHE